MLNPEEQILGFMSEKTVCFEDLNCADLCRGPKAAGRTAPE